MNGTEPGIRQTDSRKVSCIGHAGTGRRGRKDLRAWRETLPKNVLSRFHRALPRSGDAVGENVGLKKLREGVETARGAHRKRAAECELRIDDCDGGCIRVVPERFLENRPRLRPR